MVNKFDLVVLSLTILPDYLYFCSQRTKVCLFTLGNHQRSNNQTLLVFTYSSFYPQGAKMKDDLRDSTGTRD